MRKVIVFEDFRDLFPGEQTVREYNNSLVIGKAYFTSNRLFFNFNATNNTYVVGSTRIQIHLDNTADVYVV